MLGYHRPASETLFKWCFVGGPLMAANSGIWILPPPPPPFNKLKKKLSKVGPALTKISGSAHNIHVCDKNIYIPCAGPSRPIKPRIVALKC